MSDDPTNEAGIADEDLQPLVSVIIPAYNSSAYIGAALDSVFRQTFSNYEVVVVNDGSSDTTELETALQPYLSRLRYFRQENRGPSAARNLGIREACGRYVAFLDSDDFWLPHHLERHVDSLTKDATLRLVYSNNMQFRDGETIGAAFERVPQTGPVTLESLLAEQCTVNTSSVVVARESILRAGLFDESLNRCEDFDLWLRLASQGIRMAYDSEVQVYHRLGDGLSSNSERMKSARAAVYKKAAATMALNAWQKEIVSTKLRELEVELEVEAAKQHLAVGRFREARVAVQRANSLAPAARLRLAEAGLRFCPLFLRWSYGRYLDFLRWSKHRTSRSSLEGREPPNLEVLSRVLSQSVEPKR